MISPEVAMNKKLVFILIIMSAALVWVTAAYFFDQETLQGNGFKAGTMDLSLEENGPTAVQALQNGDWMPGEEIDGSIELRNDGSLPIEEISLRAETKISD